MSKSFRQLHESQAAFRRAAAFVITHPKKSGHAIVNVAYPADGAGVLKVFVKDWFGEGGGRFSMATAGGYGYDKLTAALSRTEGVDGVKLYDHCETPAKGSEEARALKRYKALGDKLSGAAEVAKLRLEREKLAKKHGIRGGYFETGLERLGALGYRVIQAL